MVQAILTAQRIAARRFYRQTNSRKNIRIYHQHGSAGDCRTGVFRITIQKNNNMPNTVKFNEDYPVITKSDELYDRALKVQKPVTQTLAKGPGQFTKGVAPKYIQRGKDSHVWDVDGNEYIDFNSAIGPISLGYAYPAV